MPADSVLLSLLSVVSLISFFVVLIVIKFSNKIGQGILLDRDFEKPQAFHKDLIPRSGGLASIISLIIFFIFSYFLFGKVFFEYLILSFALFILGFMEDLKINIRPIYRLLLMIGILITFIVFFSINIQSVDLSFLNKWMSNEIFSIFFILLCFLFIINGANLVDGFNGLLTIHLIFINLTLLFLNLNNDNQELTLIIAGQFLILLSFLLFNFPKAKIFMGDGGSYLFGSLLALNIIYTNNLNPEVSSFFFCNLLFYLFFEVFFSFFRKIFQKKSPLLPDSNHLHMIVYKQLKKINPSKDNNYLTSIFVNFGYIILIFPGIYFMESSLFSRTWFFILLVIYTLFYLRLYRLNK